MPGDRSLLPTLALTLGLAMPAAAGAQSGTTRYVAPTDRSVTATIEEGYGNSVSQVIWIRNGSTVPIHVYSVTLRDCENVKQRCSPVPLKLRVRPGGRAVLQRVQPRNEQASYRYRFTFGWRADSADVAVVRALAENGVTSAQERLAAHDAEVAEREAAVGSHDLFLEQDEIVALGDRVAGVRVEPDSVVVSVGQRFLLHDVRVLATDAAGAILGRVRAYHWRAAPDAFTIRADTVVAQQVGRTAMEIRLMPPARPLVARLPIIVVADTTR